MRYTTDSSLITAKFNNAGQSIVKLGTTGGFLSTRDALSYGINYFFNEYKNNNSSGSDNICKLSKSDDFTQMIWGNATAVGCGATQNYDGTVYWFLLTCDFSTANKIGATVHFSGAPGSKCATGTNPMYPALCSTNEVLDPNSYYMPASGDNCSGSSGSSSSNGNVSTTTSSTDFCQLNCGTTKNIGCNATDVSFKNKCI